MSDILSELYLSSELDDCINKIVRHDLRDDFKQELFLILCEQKEKVQEINSRGEIKYYVVRIIINLVNQKRNIFHKKYLLNTHEPLDDFKDDYDPDVSQEKEKKHTDILNHISDLDKHFETFYYRALTELIKKHGTMSAASRATGIPVSTISRGIKKIREHLKTVINV